MFKFFKTLLDRLEPWAIFLSILAILFVPWGKGYWWCILVAVSFIRVIRAWREAWTWFSLETIGDVLGTIFAFLLVVLLYFFLHSTWPSFVHDPPDISELHSPAATLELQFNEQAEVGVLNVIPRNDDWEVQVYRGTAATGEPLITALLLVKDLTIHGASGFDTPLPLREVTTARDVDPVRDATIRLGQKGKPIVIRMTHQGGQVMVGEVRSP